MPISQRHPLKRPTIGLAADTPTEPETKLNEAQQPPSTPVLDNSDIDDSYWFDECF